MAIGVLVAKHSYYWALAILAALLYYAGLKLWVLREFAEQSYQEYFGTSPLA